MIGTFKFFVFILWFFSASSQSTIQEPTTPAITNILFDDSGQFVKVLFDSPTDKGRQTGYFTCSSFFAFVSAHYAVCLWTDAQTLTITPRGVNRIQIGGIISLLGGRIRAQCASSNPTDCYYYTTVPVTTRLVAGALNPITPRVVISGPTSVGPCDNPVVDFTASSGNCGRNWDSVKIETSSTDPNATHFQNFFSNSYKMNPPSAIPHSILHVGYSYTVTVTLCNILKTCGSNSRTFSVIDTTPPTVTMVGGGLRSVLSKNTNTFAAKASVTSCGSDSSQSITYSWSTLCSGITCTIPNDSKDPSKFIVPAYSFTPNSVYVFNVKASLPSGLFASSSVEVNVAQSNLIAVIGGGSQQSAQMGGSGLRIDGSGSYDDGKNPASQPSDGSVDLGLSYGWSCSQTSPILNATCGLKLEKIGNGFMKDAVIRARPLDWATVGSTYAFTLTVSGSGRTSSSSISVKLTEPNSPIVTVSSSLKSGTKAVTSNQLVLYGTVQLSVSTVATWSLDDLNIPLSSNSLTVTSKKLSPGIHNMNLVLSANALYGKVVPYTFLLSCGSTSATIQIYANLAPQPGLFTIQPPEGYAMDTSFFFVAQSWSDDDNFPISYEFGYISSSGQYLTVQSKSPLSYGTTLLPPGSVGSRYYIGGRVRVYDVYDAQNTADVYVKVQQQVISDADMSNKISSSLETNTDNTDGLKQVISVASSMLNYKDCMSAPDCKSLNRNNCSATINTCGECFETYIGRYGDDNSYCASREEFAILKRPSGSNTACTDDIQCSPWEFCDIYDSFTCVRLSQECLDYCTDEDHGDCRFVDVSYGVQLDDCLMGDVTCRAECVCKEGYFGPSCALTAEEMEAKADMRNQLMSGVLTLTEIDESNVQTVESWLAGLASSAGNQYELNSASIDATTKVAQAIVNAGEIIGMPYDTLLNLLGTLNTLMSASSSLNRRRRLQSSNNSTIKILQDVGRYTASQMIEGQSEVGNVQDSFSMSSIVASAGASTDLSIPLSATDIANGGKPSVVSVESTNTAPVTAISLKAKNYDDNSQDFSANPIQLNYREDSDIQTVSFTFYHLKAMNFYSIGQDLSQDILCELGSIVIHKIACPTVGGSIEEFSYQCDGLSDYYMTLSCPTTISAPTCNIRYGSFNCSVSDYTAEYTTCSCTKSGSRKLDSTLQESGALEVVASSSLVGTGFETTMKSASDLDSAGDLKKVMLVLFLYGGLWATGLVGILFCTFQRIKIQSKVKAEGSHLDKKKEEAKAKKSKEAIKDYLLTYAYEALPSVFRPQGPLQRLWGEISKHHRYIVIFTASGQNGSKIKMLTTVHLLTVQAMLMFMLAVVYDIQFPNDDGRCATFDNQEDCLKEKSPFDTSTSFCTWQLDEENQYECVFVSPKFTWQSCILLSIIVAIFTAPVNLLVDFLFHDLLFAPTADSIKVAAEESTLSKVGRRVSTNIRRASAVGVEIASNVAKKARSTFLKSGSEKLKLETTLVVPDSAAEAHMLAYTSGIELINEVKSANESVINRRKTERSQSLLAKANRTTVQVNKRNLIIPNRPKTSVDDLFNELVFDIVEQRRLLLKSEQEDFDNAWGIDPTGEFSRQRTLFFWRSFNRNSKSVIKEELILVQKQTASKIEKLRFATDVHTGLEILHLFVLDVLGRDTAAAKIFLTKSDQDFRHSMVVTNWVKGFAWIMVLFLNLFFIYFSLLRGLERGLHWQKVFTGACIMQMWIEVVFYETTECAIVHYLIPSLVRNEVQSVSETLKNAIEIICSPLKKEYDLVLDVTQYLYVSTNVAKQFPNLLESVIVQSYHTIYPGEIGRKWRIHHSFSTSHDRWRWVRSISISVIIMSILQNIGASSPTLQRIMIHSLQPLLLSAIVVLIYLVYKNPLLSIPVAAILLYFAYRLYRAVQLGHQRRREKVLPVEEGKERDISTPSESSNTMSDPHKRLSIGDESMVQPNSRPITRPEAIPEVKNASSSGIESDSKDDSDVLPNMMRIAYNNGRMQTTTTDHHTSDNHTTDQQPSEGGVSGTDNFDTTDDDNANIRKPEYVKV